MSILLEFGKCDFCFLPPKIDSIFHNSPMVNGKCLPCRLSKLKLAKQRV